MTKHIFILILAVAATASAQPAVTAPQIGFMLDSGGALRPVYGLAGNFVLGDPVAKGVLSAAYSGTAGWLKTDSSLAVFDSHGHTIASQAAPSGPALFALSTDGTPAFAYLVSSNALLQWSGGKFVSVPLNAATIAADAVISIAAPTSDHVALIIQRQNALWLVRVSIATGQVDSQSALPGIPAPALFLPGVGLISTDSHGIVITNRDGSATHIAATLPKSFDFEQMGAGWLELRDLANPLAFAVRIVAPHQGVYVLPERTPEVTQ